MQLSQGEYDMLKIASPKLKYTYSAVMIRFPDVLANKIKVWCKKKVPTKNVSTEGDAKGREDQIHCTVKFGLHTNNAEEIAKILDGFGKFSVRLGAISRFTASDDFDVLKIEVESKKLRELHSLLSDLPNSDKHKAYKPHATISYINKGSSQSLSGNDTFSGERFEVDKIIFSPVLGDKTTLEL